LFGNIQQIHGFDTGQVAVVVVDTLVMSAWPTFVLGHGTMAMMVYHKIIGMHQ